MILSSSLSVEECIRYSQQMKLEAIGQAGQEKLKNARVLCVGLGGLGSPLLLYLAAAGVGTLGIMDDDVVDLSNLQRQILYDVSRIGQQKAVAARERIVALNPSIQVKVYVEKITSHNASELISEYDLVAEGSDNFETRYLVHDTCFSLHKPYVYASVNQFKGYCSIFDGANGPCFRCLFPAPPQDATLLNCNDAGVMGVAPGLLGIIQATEIIKWILQMGNSLQGRLLSVDLLNMRFQEIRLAQNPDCELCQR